MFSPAITANFLHFNLSFLVSTFAHFFFFLEFHTSQISQFVLIFLDSVLRLPVFKEVGPTQLFSFDALELSSFISWNSLSRKKTKECAFCSVFKKSVKIVTFKFLKKQKNKLRSDWWVLTLINYLIKGGIKYILCRQVFLTKSFFLTWKCQKLWLR